MVRRAFDILGIEVTKDKRAIKKAYALLAKQYHPEEHPAEWEKIYGAYQAALEYAQTTEGFPKEESGRETFIDGGSKIEESTGLADEEFEENSTEFTSKEFQGEDASGANPAMDKASSISSDAAYGELFQEARNQWLRKKTLHEQIIHKKLSELVRLRGRKAVKEWQHFFETDFTVSEGEETLMLLLEELQENELSEKVFRLILQTMNTRLKVYAEMEDNDRAITTMEIVKYCAGQLPLLHRKTENRRKLIGIPAALTVGFLLLAMTGQHKELLNESNVSQIAAEYLNEKYDVTDHAAADLETEKVRIIGSNEDKIDSYAVRERASGNVIAYAIRDIEDQESTFVCFDNLQEPEIKASFEEKLNALTGHDEGRLFWNSSISDSMSGGLEDGFFQAKYEGDFDAFIRQETEARSNAPGVLTSFLISDYSSMNGRCDYYLPDPAVRTMRERFELTEYTEDTELQASLQQGAADYQIQIRGVVLPEILFQERIGQATGKQSRIYVNRDVHGTLGMEPSMSFLMLTGWYVNLPPQDEKILNISSGMYMQPVISMGEGIYGTESSIKGQGFETDPAWITGSMIQTENPASLGLTEAEEKKAVSFRLADGYILKNNYCLAIDKKLYGIADTDYRVMVTKQKGFSMNVADKNLEVEDNTALEKYVSSYGDPSATLGMWDVLDGEGYLFMEYQAAETAEEADIITIIN